MNSLKFYKMSGAGNDFVLLDNNDNPDLSLSGELIRKMCDRRFGIGADGVLYISDSEDMDFEMKYFNADGGVGSLCGNGARCAVRFAEKSNKFDGMKTKFRCGSSLYKGEIRDENNVTFYLNDPEDFRFDLKIKSEEKIISADFADTGSPHLVVDATIYAPDTSEKDGLDLFAALDVIGIGKELRYADEFSPQGTNVNFFMFEGDTLHIRTYERGVENETLACGTGSVAAALILSRKRGIKAPVKLKTLGGDVLFVNFNVDKNSISDVSLTGPAEIVFEGKFFINI